MSKVSEKDGISTSSAIERLARVWRRPERLRIRFGGYLPTDTMSLILFNVPTALMLLTVSLPFFLIIPVIIFLQDGRPILYKGERMGRNKRPFFMYKFRTLIKDAERKTGGDLLTPKHKLETSTGKILRETRLDELPQLINVVRGEMNLVGPRPERQAVYDKHCKDIPGYDKRFAVRPGIIGYSQLFTPHSAPKRVRALIDNYYTSRQQRWWLDIIFFARAIFWLARRAAVLVFRKLAEAVVRLIYRRAFAHAERESERLRPPATEVLYRITGSDDEFHSAGQIDDISDEGLVFFLAEDLCGEKLDLILKIEGRFPPRRGIKRKIAKCSGEVLRVWSQAENRRRHVVIFQPNGNSDLLKIHQYFLAKSIA